MSPCVPVEEVAVGLREADAHFAECARCRGELARFREIEETLRAGAEDDATPEEIEGGLQAARHLTAKKHSWKEVVPMAAAAAVLFAILAWFVALRPQATLVGPQEEETLSYRVTSGKPEHRKQILEVLAKRCFLRDLNPISVKEEGEDRIVVRIRKGDATAFKHLTAVGLLEFRAVATKELHERALETGKAPDGYEWLANDNRLSGEYAHLGEARILVRKTSAFGGGDMSRVEIAQDLRASGPHWMLEFDLTKEGEKRMDAVAKELYNQNPRGLLAIAYDGKILSKPTIQSEAFGGKGQVTGVFTKEEAAEMALILQSGSLPCPIERE